MARLAAQIDELVRLMAEYNLERAKLKGEDWSVEFSRKAPAGRAVVTAFPTAGLPDPSTAGDASSEQADQAQPGAPVLAPTMGVFYTSPSPGAPPFVQVGDTVAVGQTIGLIEAMKVFNEIPSPVSGRVVEIIAEGGQLVHPGDVLMRIG